VLLDDSPTKKKYFFIFESKCFLLIFHLIFKSIIKL
jgi:hypothetical protein